MVAPRKRHPDKVAGEYYQEALILINLPKLVDLLYEESAQWAEPDVLEEASHGVATQAVGSRPLED